MAFRRAGGRCGERWRGRRQGNTPRGLHACCHATVCACCTKSSLTEPKSSSFSVPVSQPPEACCWARPSCSSAARSSDSSRPGRRAASSIVEGCTLGGAPPRRGSSQLRQAPLLPLDQNPRPSKALQGAGPTSLKCCMGGGTAGAAAIAAPPLFQRVCLVQPAFASVFLPASSGCACEPSTAAWCCWSGARPAAWRSRIRLPCRRCPPSHASRQGLPTQCSSQGAGRQPPPPPNGGSASNCSSSAPSLCNFAPPSCRPACPSTCWCRPAAAAAPCRPTACRWTPSRRSPPPCAAR